MSTLKSIAVFSIVYLSGCNTDKNLQADSEGFVEIDTAAPPSSPECARLHLYAFTQSAINQIANDPSQDGGGPSLAMEYATDLSEALDNSGVECTAVHWSYKAYTYTDDQLDNIMLGIPALINAHYAIRYGMKNRTNVEEVRRDIRADIVIVVAGDQHQYPGFSTIVRGDEVEDVLFPYASVTWANSQSVLHETGHLLGGAHDRDTALWLQPCWQYSPSYRCGFVDEPFVSIMAYESSCDGACDRQNIFSNPDINPPGGGSGGDPGFAFNACLIHQLWNYVTSFSCVLNDDCSYSPVSLSAGFSLCSIE